MDLSISVYLWILISLAKGVCCTNSPPSLSSSKHWIVLENDEVGTLVTTLRAMDYENDPITFSLESMSSEEIHTYFTIDQNQRVKIVKPLTGLAKQGSADYIIRVRMDDGTTSPVAEVRLEVRNRNQNRDTHGGRRGPSNVGIPFIRSPPAFSNAPILPGQIVNFRNQVPGYDIGPIPRLREPEPLRVQIDDKMWTVNADAPVGTTVGVINVSDALGAGYNLTLDGSQGLLRVDDGGRVQVAKPLTGQVGDLKVMAWAMNIFSKNHEQAVLRILPPVSTSPAPSSLPAHSTVTPITSRTSAPTAKVSDRASNSQDLRVVDSKSGGTSTTGSPTEVPKEAPDANISLTVIPIVLVVGISPIALMLYCYWRRIQRRKARAEAKESAVVYTEKAEEAIATQVPPRRTNSSDNQSKRNKKIGFAALFHKRAQSNKYEDDLNAAEGIDKNKLNEFSAPVGDTWEFPRHHLKFMGILGEGCFGQVWKCEAVSINSKGPMLVAVKTLKECAGEREHKDLVQELKVLKNLGKHINVVSLLGCCSEKGPLFIILEYMIGGKLQSFLRSSRADASYNNLHGTSSSLTPRDLTLFTYQISRGMEFLARNGIIHRDLAARNVLLGEDKVCKVADFGFARDVANNHIYERKSDGRLPIRWMAPESLFDNIFITKSDVWSFGVLLWEIVTLGSTPYPGLGAAEVMKKVKEGYRLEKPDHCRREVYNIMYYCWDKEPNERPSFTELVHTLEGLLLSEVEYIELDRFPDHAYYNVIAEKSDNELL